MQAEKGIDKYRVWLRANAVDRAVRGFLPSFIDGDASKLRVIVDDSMQPRTDGKTIWVSLIPDALEEKYTPEDWLLLLRAAAAHETQHVNSSNFSDIQSIMDWYGAYLFDNYKLNRNIGKSIAKDMLNIVEDGRIENIAVHRRPGMFTPFYALNYIIRQGTAIQKKTDKPEDVFGHFIGNILSYAKTGLYAPGIEAYQNTEMEQVFLSIQPLIDQGVKAYSSEDCRKVVEDILRKAAPFLAKLIQQSPALQSQQQQGGGGAGDAEYTSNGESEFNEPGDDSSGGNSPQLRSDSPVQEDSKSQSNKPSHNEPPDDQSSDDSAGNQSSDKNSDNNPSEGKSSDSNSAGNHSPDSKPSGFGSAKEMKDLPKDDAENAKKQAQSELDSANRAKAKEQRGPVLDGLDRDSIQKIKQCYKGHTAQFAEEPVKIYGTEKIPAELKTQATTLRRAISRVINDRKREYRGLRRGNLDTSVLWKTGVGNNDIFMKKGCPEQFSAAFYLLIDNSGSMHGDKYVSARRAAAVIETAIQGLIPCKISLFNTSSGLVHTHVIKGFEEKTGNDVSRCWNSISSVHPDGYNSDSINIRVAAEQLIRRRERKKVLFVLSDGTPSAYSSEETAIMEVKKAVADSRKRGVIVIPIMFGDAEFLASYGAKYKEMYEKNIIACRPQEITQRLSALFEQLIKM